MVLYYKALIVFFLCAENLALFPLSYSERGECRENKNYFGMHRLQAKKLRHNEGQESSSRQDGNQKVLQILPKAYFAQRNQVIKPYRKEK